MEYNKNFDFLLDFVTATKLYKTYVLDDTTDEFDILLYETVIYFKKRLAKINLNYVEYKEIINYFDELKVLYGLFRNAELSEISKLAYRLEQLKSKSAFITYYLF